MVRTLTWVLVGIVAYMLATMALRTRGLLPESVRLQGPITTIHTKRGRALLDRLAAPRRFWRAWGNFGVGIALVVMVGSFLAVLLAGYRSVTSPTASPVSNPQNVLVIPGVNEFLPLSAAPEIVFGLLVGLVVHEGGHGLLCRVEDIDIDSMGLALFTVVPIGAFVDPSDESRERADRGAQTRMFAAGVTNNFAISVVAFALLFGPLMGSVVVVDGAAVGDVFAGSAAESAGLEHGDVITAIEGRPVANASDLDAALADADARSVRVTLRDGGTTTVERSLTIVRAVPEVLRGAEGGVDLDGETPPTVRAVNGTRVHTERGFQAAMAGRSVARLSTDRGEATVPVGAYVARVDPEGALAAAGAPTDGTPLVLTHVGDARIPNTTALQNALAERRPGETVTVEAVLEGETRRYEVELGADPSGEGAFLGVGIRPGTTGIVVDDFGIDAYPADLFLGLLGGGGGFLGGLTGGEFLRQVGAVLLLPFLGAVEPTISYSFAGFVGPVRNFYALRGPLAGLGGGVFLLANVMFWTGWVNLQLGLFNCIPSFPLDGGHILRTSTEAIVSRLPVSGGRALTSAVTLSVSLTMLVGLVLMVFGPQLFA